MASVFKWIGKFFGSQSHDAPKAPAVPSPGLGPAMPELFPGYPGTKGDDPTSHGSIPPGEPLPGQIIMADPADHRPIPSGKPFIKLASVVPDDLGKAQAASGSGLGMSGPTYVPCGIDPTVHPIVVSGLPIGGTSQDAPRRDTAGAGPAGMEDPTGHEKIPPGKPPVVK